MEATLIMSARIVVHIESTSGEREALAFTKQQRQQAENLVAHINLEKGLNSYILEISNDPSLVSGELMKKSIFGPPMPKESRINVFDLL